MSERKIEEIDKLVKEADEFRQKNDYTTAMTKLNEALKIDSNDELVHFNIGYTYMLQNNFDHAIVHYEKAVQINPTYYSALASLGYSLSQVERLEEALDIINKAIYIKDEPDLHHTRGAILEKLGKLWDALGEYENYLKSKPDDIPVLGTTGRLLEELGKNIYALEKYEKILKLNPNMYMAYYDLVVVHQKLGNFNKASEFMDKVLEFSRNNLISNPPFIELLSEKGKILYNLKNYEESIVYYDKVLTLESKNEPVLYNKIESYRMLNKYDKALELINQVIDHVQKPQLFLEIKLAILKSMERYDDVIKLADTLIKADLTNVVYVDYKSFSLEQLHRIDDSIHAYDEFLKVNPGNLLILGRKLQLLRRNNRMKEEEKTISLIRKTADSLPDTGENYSKAIIITGNSDYEGTQKVYRTLNLRFGERNKDWFSLRQGLESANGRAYDKMEIKLANNERKIVYFDITSTVGKF